MDKGSSRTLKQQGDPIVRGDYQKEKFRGSGYWLKVLKVARGIWIPVGSIERLFGSWEENGLELSCLQDRARKSRS